jgi:hypothetical protein
LTFLPRTNSPQTGFVLEYDDATDSKSNVNCTGQNVLQNSYTSEVSSYLLGAHFMGTVLEMATYQWKSHYVPILCRKLQAHVELLLEYFIVKTEKSSLIRHTQYKVVHFAFPNPMIFSNIYK